MGYLELVGQLRKYGLWNAGRKARRAVGPFLCTGIHGAVERLGRRFTSTDLYLKHVYDYRPIYVNPAEVRLILRPGEWRHHRNRSLWGSFRTWREQGDGPKSVRSHITRNLHGQFLLAGDWDTGARPMEVLPVVVQLFEEGKKPEETDTYQKHLRNLQARRLTWAKNWSSVEDLDAYFARLIDIYEDISTSGYRTQGDLDQIGDDEIRICINRNGDMCVFGGGTHRLSMAKLLELDRVPVILKRVHTDWVHSWMQQSDDGDPIEAVHRGVASLEASSADASEPIE